MARLFVGNLPLSVTEDEVRGIFERHGAITAVEIRPGKGEKNKDFSTVFVEFSEEAPVEAALASPEETFNGQKLRLEKAKPAAGAAAPKEKAPIRRSDFRVKITNLPPGTSWQDLKDHMRSVGDVGYSDVFRTRTREEPKTGVVEYATEDELKAAIERLNNSEFTSRSGDKSVITVFVDDGVRDEPPREPRPDRGGDRHGGRGGRAGDRRGGDRRDRGDDRRGGGDRRGGDRGDRYGGPRDSYRDYAYDRYGGGGGYGYPPPAYGAPPPHDSFGAPPPSYGGGYNGNGGPPAYGDYYRSGYPPAHPPSSYPPYYGGGSGGGRPYEDRGRDRPYDDYRRDDRHRDRSRGADRRRERSPRRDYAAPPPQDGGAGYSAPHAQQYEAAPGYAA